MGASSPILRKDIQNPSGATTERYHGCGTESKDQAPQAAAYGSVTFIVRARVGTVICASRGKSPNVTINSKIQESEYQYKVPKFVPQKCEVFSYRFRPPFRLVVSPNQCCGLEARERHNRSNVGTIGMHFKKPEKAMILDPEDDPTPIRRVRTSECAESCLGSV